jgi:putative transposase
MRYRRARVEGASYFFTLVTETRRPIFADSSEVAALYRAIECVRARHPFEIEAIVVLPDLLHTLWQLLEGDSDFAGRWRLIKSHFTRNYLKSHAPPERSQSRASKGEQSVWQRRYWEHLIRDEADFDNHFDYIHFNPVRHGLVTAPLDYPHSSFARWVTAGRYEPDWGSSLMPKWPSSVGKE